MNVICEEQTFREMSQSFMIDQADDAWHPLEDRNYIEWWYYDLMNEDGSIVRGNFYVSGDLSRSNKVKTGVRASYVTPDGREILIAENFPYSSFSSSTRTCDVKIGGNFIKGDLSHYELHIDDGEKALDLELDSEMKGFRSHACFGDETKCMFWVVPQPRGRAKGTFKTKKKTFDIDGVGYRDHNWLNFFPPDAIAYWDWGRVNDTEFTFIFADIVTNKKYNGAEIKPLIIYDAEKLIYLTNESHKWSLIKSDVTFDRETKTDFPGTLVVSAHDDQLFLEMQLHREKIFQRIDLLADFNPLVRFLIRTFKAKPMITSFLSTGPGKLNLSGRESVLSCTAVHEFVQNS